LNLLHFVGLKNTYKKIERLLKKHFSFFKINELSMIKLEYQNRY
jgi:hypothetical protein